MTKEEKTELAKSFFRQVMLFVEDMVEDEIYSEVDPDNEFGDELPNELNLDTIRDVIRLGFFAKYGTPLGM